MKILVIEPHKRPQTADIPNELHEMQRIVEGSIACTCPWDDPVGLVHNDNAALEGKPLNRALTDSQNHIYDIVSGTFFLVGLKDDEFVDLPANLMEKYRKLFALPEYFLRKPDGTISILMMDVD